VRLSQQHHNRKGNSVKTATITVYSPRGTEALIDASDKEAWIKAGWSEKKPAPKAETKPETKPEEKGK
jgi:hypothetical protein